MRVRDISFLIFTCIIISVILIGVVWAAVPSGPVITYVRNETSVASGNPTLENNISITGGVIATLILNARQADSHWKAYVGNVTGSYVLEDASNYSIYEWNISTIAGEVYATRTSSMINWSGVRCANSTHVSDEMTEMHHNLTNTPGDAINDTFDDDANDHWGFYSGPTQIIQDTCNYSIQTWINDSTQSSTEWFEEVLLYDGSANLVYATKIENNVDGYKNDAANSTYDFQMLIAENGSPATTHTDYYFYVELS